MTTFLKEAFTLACAIPHKINEYYDYAGYTLWRAMTDDSFLAVNTTAIKSPHLREAAELYDWAKSRTQHSLFDNIHRKGAASDLGPQPDIKPGLIKVVKTGLEYWPRTNFSPGMIAAVTLTSVFLLTHAMMQNGVPHGDDLAGTWMSLNSGQKHHPKL